jgi:ribosomal protein S18 acetylase RimI-like enzyme
MPQLSLSGVASVRDARLPDRQAIRNVLLAAYREYAAVVPPAIFGPYLADLLDLDARARDGRLLVAGHGGRVAGTVTYHPDAAAEGFGWPAGWAGLRALGVDPAARGRGIGRALVEACQARAEAAGAPVLCLHTASFMTAAVRLYETAGFRREPTHDLDVGPHLRPEAGPSVRILAYRLDLPR